MCFFPAQLQSVKLRAGGENGGVELSGQILLFLSCPGLPMEDTDPPFNTPEGFWGLKTWPFEGPKSIGSIWEARLLLCLGRVLVAVSGTVGPWKYQKTFIYIYIYIYIYISGDQSSTLAIGSIRSRVLGCSPSRGMVVLWFRQSDLSEGFALRHEESCIVP